MTDLTAEGRRRLELYVRERFGAEDDVLAELGRRAASLPEGGMQISADVGKLLYVLALTVGARRVLELGTFLGYSAIWMARALPPDGRLVSLEREPAYAEVARTSIECAGLADRVEIRLGRARDSLAELEREGAGPFDMAFIDADKEPYADYLRAVLRLSAPGTLIVADNVVRGGTVAGGPSDDPAVTGIQRFNAALAGDPGLAGAIVQMVGTKGHDGMALAVVR